MDNVKDKNNNIFWKGCALAFLIILFLFALNNRYHIEDNFIIDKWLKKCVYWTEWYDEEKY